MFEKSLIVLAYVGLVILLIIVSYCVKRHINLIYQKYFNMKRENVMKSMEEQEEMPSAKEAYAASEPRIRNNVWRKVNEAKESGSTHAYWHEDTKMPADVVEELVDKGYSLEVHDYSFSDAPSVIIYFNREAVGELLLVSGDRSFGDYAAVPLSIEEYEKMGRRK